MLVIELEKKIYLNFFDMALTALQASRRSSSKVELFTLSSRHSNSSNISISISISIRSSSKVELFTLSSRHSDRNN